MTKLLFILLIIFFFVSCKNKIEKYNNQFGLGPFKNINFNPNNLQNANKGKKLYIKYCVSCHLYNSKHSIGPSWIGITERFHPIWILNFICNTEEMLKFDPYLQKQIKQYKLKMPHFEIDTNEAKAIYSFMYLKDNE